MSSPNPILVFDRALVRRRRERAAPAWTAHSALFDEISEQLMDRLMDVKRDFTSLLYCGAPHKIWAEYFHRHESAFVVTADVSEEQLRQADIAVIADEEMLPFSYASFDLIVSNTTMHWVNDLPGALLQLKKVLRSDGLFLGTVLGGQTLNELRTCLLEAELKVTGGVSPRLSPTIELQTASGLLQRAGFRLPVTDLEKITLTYPDAFSLMRDLRGMGETNAHRHRLRYPTRRAVFEQAAQLYQKHYSLPDGQIPATFEVLFLHGWA